jgi:carbonic anhydrase
MDRNTIFIPLVFVLVSLMLIGAEQAHATNESSYKYGYEQGKGEWGNCQNFDADCSIALDDCHSPVDIAVKYASDNR